MEPETIENRRRRKPSEKEFALDDERQAPKPIHSPAGLIDRVIQTHNRAEGHLHSKAHSENTKNLNLWHIFYCIAWNNKTDHI